MSAGAGQPREVVAGFVRAAAYEDAVFAARARGVLGPDERKALARLRDAGARRDYLAAHALARTLIAGVAGCAPDRLRLRSSPRGRPEIGAPPGALGCRFSLSHADGIALCAVSARHDVGADVESSRNIGPDPLGVADVVCSRRERRALLLLPPSGRVEYLLHLWTLKEAITKAMGVGFHFPFDRITVRWDDGRPAAVEIDAASTPAASQWRLAWTRLTPEHVAAVAVLGADAAIRFEESLPVGGSWIVERRSWKGAPRSTIHGP